MSRKCQLSTREVQLEDRLDFPINGSVLVQKVPINSVSTKFAFHRIPALLRSLSNWLSTATIKASHCDCA